MELHAQGLRELGHRARVWCAEDLPSTRWPALDARTPGSRSLAALWPLARREGPDVYNVHTLSAPAWIAAERLGLLGRARVVVMSYAADERGLALGRGVRGLLRWLRIAGPARAMLPLASGVWCVNNQDRAFYLERYRLSADRVAVIPHAADDLFYATSSEVAQRERQQLLFVGTWIQRKGIDILRSVVPTLLGRWPSLRIVLAGTIAEEAQVRAAFPDSAQAALRVVARTSPEELRALYQTSTLLLLPSELEGLPIVLLEAMASGCPSLAAANSGMLDVIREGENGWLLASREPDAWAARIEMLLRAPEGLRLAGDGARRTAEDFRVERVTARALEFYGSITNRPM
jgi:glycosyltransferase involved in cell wall biosynthesis